MLQTVTNFIYREYTKKLFMETFYSHFKGSVVIIGGTAPYV